MDDVLGYEGSRAVVTGAASGMGAAVADLLVALGAEVVGLDRAEIAGDQVRSVHIDLLDPASIAAAVDAVDGPVDALFNCAGLPGAPFSERDTMIVNFLGGRAVVEGLVPKIVRGGAVVYVASAGGIGWEGNIETYRPLYTTDRFEDGVTWLDANEDVWSWSGYAASKQVINAWVSWRSAALMGDHGIRLNCINPGPTDTAMLPAFHESAGKDLVDSALGPIGRYSTAEEQAWPMLVLNSPRLSYVIGETFFTDGGFHSGLLTGTLDMSALTPPEG